jgi:hypothetical protein
VSFLPTLLSRQYGFRRLIVVVAVPQIARDENFADSAQHAGMKYEELLQKVITQG